MQKLILLTFFYFYSQFGQHRRATRIRRRGQHSEPMPGGNSGRSMGSSRRSGEWKWIFSMIAMSSLSGTQVSPNQSVQLPLQREDTRDSLQSIEIVVRANRVQKFDRIRFLEHFLIQNPMFVLIFSDFRDRQRHLSAGRRFIIIGKCQSRTINRGRRKSDHL